MAWRVPDARMRICDANTINAETRSRGAGRGGRRCFFGGGVFWRGARLARGVNAALFFSAAGGQASTAPESRDRGKMTIGIGLANLGFYMGWWSSSLLGWVFFTHG